MASFYSGDPVSAVVADIGGYATKIGWAGDDYPRSYFRSNVAILRQKQQQGVSSDASTTGANGTSTPAPLAAASQQEGGASSAAPDVRQPQRQRRRSPVERIHYDSYSRLIIKENDSDGDWQMGNPVDPVTGLWYDYHPRTNNNKKNNEQPTTGSTAAAVTSKTNDEASSEGKKDPPPSSMNDNFTATATSKNCGADWYDLLQLFIKHGYDSALKADVTSHPLLLVERSYNPPPIRQQALECLFEELNVPATFFAKDAALSCYGCGRTTGTVVDIGYIGTTVTPVYDGYVESKGIRRSPIGVLQMDELILHYMDELKRSLPGVLPNGTTPATAPYVMPLYQVRRKPDFGQRAPAFHHTARLYMALQCREAGAGAAINTNPGFHAPHRSFELPDGTTILDIPSAHRFAVSNLVYGSDPESAQRRQDIYNKQKERLGSLIQQAVLEDDEDDEDDDNDVSNDSSSRRNKKLKLSGNDREDKFSDAAAVGISKRKTQKSEVGGTTTAPNDKSKPSPFCNRTLQKACASYLQTHLNEHLAFSPVASMICDAAYRCDRDQQVQLLGNVVVGGGGACLGPTEQSVPDFIREQVESIIHQHTPGWRVKVLAPGTQERSVLAWLGGSILGSLGTFHDMWITKAEYEEWGCAIVNRKCP